MARMARTADSIVSLKVTLRGIRPPIWRRLLVLGKATLGNLHETIQAAMGWEGYHLHGFNVAGRTYGDPHSVDDVADEERLTVDGVLGTGVVRFTYTYDFGDNWEHTIAIEAKQPPIVGRSYPACVAGKRNCPPEDCGGPWGYQELLAALANPAHPEHREWIQAIGKDFDPEAFSVELADASIAARFGRP
jgi:Plasmid pRiA4b ORF-3-like protein